MSIVNALIEDSPPSTKPTDDIWPAKRQKMLLKNLGEDVSNMTDGEIKAALKKRLSKWHTSNE